LAVSSVTIEYADFDLSNGTITGGNTSQATITPVVGYAGWYRISLYITPNTSTSGLTWLELMPSSTAVRFEAYAGTGSVMYGT
jgi:hypothetical protein